MARRIVLGIVALHSVLVLIILILPYHSTLDKSRSTLFWPHKLAWKCTRIQVFITFYSILLRQSALRAQLYMRDFPISIFSMILVRDLFRTYFAFIPDLECHYFTSLYRRYQPMTTRHCLELKR